MKALPMDEARKLLADFRLANPIRSFIEVPQGMSADEARARLESPWAKTAIDIEKLMKREGTYGGRG